MVINLVPLKAVKFYLKNFNLGGEKKKQAKNPKTTLFFKIQNKILKPKKTTFLTARDKNFYTHKILRVFEGSWF